MKLVVDAKSDRVVGCHMLGPDAPEIIQGLAIAVKCGATKRQFDQTVGIHPSAAEEFVTMREKTVRPDEARGGLSSIDSPTILRLVRRRLRYPVDRTLNWPSPAEHA